MEVELLFEVVVVEELTAVFLLFERKGILETLLFFVLPFDLLLISSFSPLPSSFDFFFEGKILDV